MGGHQSVTQTQNYLTQRLTTVVSDTLVKKTTNVNMESSGSQTIEDIEYIMVPSRDWCPAETAPGAYDHVNKKSVNFIAVVNMANVSAMDIVSSIRSELQSQVDSKLKSEKSGSLVVGDNSNVNTNINVTDQTWTNITNTVKLTVETQFKQVDTSNQRIKRLKIPQPCVYRGQPNPIISNKSLITMMASDIATNVMKTVQDSNEWKSYTTDLKAAADIKNEDIGAQLRDTVKSITGMVGGIATGALLMPVLIIGGFLFFLLVLIRGFPGGGGGKNGGGQMMDPRTINALSEGATNVIGGLQGASGRPPSRGGWGPWGRRLGRLH